MTPENRISIFEVRTADNLAIRVEADDLEGAAIAAGPELPEDAEADVYPAELPVGWEGSDPEEGLALE